jgi:tetratricopeptide (TPR) repeat protein
MGGSSGSTGGGQRSEPQLLLRFSLPGLPADEIYVTHKLTIGRTSDNVCVIREQEVDQRADQYALGVMCYELLTGDLPRGSWRPPSEINPTVPPAFDKVLERPLAPQAEQRYQSLWALIDELAVHGLIVGPVVAGGGRQAAIARTVSRAKAIFQDKTVWLYAVPAIVAAFGVVVGIYLLFSAARTPPTAEHASQAEASNNRGVAYYGKGDLDKAIADYAEAIRLDPKYALAYYNRGVAYEKKGEWDNAIAEYTEAIRLDPKYARAYNNRGNAYYGKGDWDKAIADYTEAIRLDPKYAWAYRNRGNAYEKKGEKLKAAEDFARAKQLGLKP